MTGVEKATAEGAGVNATAEGGGRHGDEDDENQCVE